jgi:addiction module HigA family antidote
VLPALKMTQTEFAELLDVSRLSVSELLHEKRFMSPEMAVRVGTLLDTSPESWLRMQEAVDLWCIQQEPSKLGSVKRLDKSRLALVAA